MNTDKLLSELVARLQKAYGTGLRSVLLYGSAATGDFHHRHSDLNVLCILDDLNVDNLEKAEQIANWWRSLGNPAPLLMAEGELERASDAFPIEFLDMREQHRVLHGDDPVARVTVDPAFHRVQVEHELRAKLLALRQRYLGIYRNKGAVLRLMVDSLPSFAALFRHALILAAGNGAASRAVPVKKREVLEAAAGRFGFDASPFLAILDLREGKTKLRQVEARSTFQGYYAGVIRVCQQVDLLAKQKGATR